MLCCFCAFCRNVGNLRRLIAMEVVRLLSICPSLYTAINRDLSTLLIVSDSDRVLEIMAVTLRSFEAMFLRFSRSCVVCYWFGFRSSWLWCHT